MTDLPSKTLRLHMPQWQGGNLAEYHLSSRMLSWLLPSTDGAEATVPVPVPLNLSDLLIEDGILAKRTLLGQARAARAAIESHRPDRIVTIGGDCLVDLAPIAYLNNRYAGAIGVLWIDAHPDVQSTKETFQGNAQVLAMLLGSGDPDFVGEIDRPLRPDQVMYAGLDEWSAAEDDFMRQRGLQRAGSEQLRTDSRPVLDWISRQKIKRLAVHLDMDALNPREFRSNLFNKPDGGADFLNGVPRGHLRPDAVLRLLSDVGTVCDIVGLAITEYISWDALQTRDFIGRLPLIGI